MEGVCKNKIASIRSTQRYSRISAKIGNFYIICDQVVKNPNIVGAQQTI